MRKACLCVLMFCLAACAGCAGANVEEMSSLPGLSKPYAGEYACKRLLLGGRDLAGEYASFTLTLTYGGEAVFAWERAEGGRGEYTLDYEVAREGDAIVFFPRSSGGAPCAFCLEKGSVRLGFPLGGRLFYAEFAR